MKKVSCHKCGAAREIGDMFVDGATFQRGAVLIMREGKHWCTSCWNELVFRGKAPARRRWGMYGY